MIEGLVPGDSDNPNTRKDAYERIKETCLSLIGNHLDVVSKNIIPGNPGYSEIYLRSNTGEHFLLTYVTDLEEFQKKFGDKAAENEIRLIFSMSDMTLEYRIKKDGEVTKTELAEITPEDIDTSKADLIPETKLTVSEINSLIELVTNSVPNEDFYPESME